MPNLHRLKRSKRAIRLFRLSWLAVGLLLTPALCSRADAEGVVDAAGGFSFELQDQFGQTYTQHDFKTDYLLLVGGDRQASDASRTQAQAVRELLKDRGRPLTSVEIIRVADLRGVPAVLRSMVSKKMQKKYSVPVLLDWGGALVGRYEFEPEVVNIALIERTGRAVLLPDTGLSAEEQIQRVEQALEELASSANEQLSDRSISTASSGV